MSDAGSKSLPNRPKVLLTDTNRWALSARLAISLAEAGCEVSAVCVTPGHALLKTRAVRATFPYRGLHPVSSLQAAIEATDPDLIVPCCDRSVGHLHQLYASSQRQHKSKVAALIERSLGAPASYPIVASRYELLKIASEEGVRVPHTERLTTPQQFAAWQASGDLPCVLKADGTWGGGGTRIVDSSDEIRSSLRQLLNLFRLKRAIKRLVVNRDPFWLLPWWHRLQHEVIVQSYITGAPANCAVACWNGRVLAGSSVEVISSEGVTGPASIVRLIENQEMMSAAVRIADRLKLSGLFGLDFIIEESSKTAYLIEMNPRSTPLCHLRLGRGRDIAGALWAQLVGQPSPDTPPVTRNPMIAYFPQAQTGESEFLRASYQDVPLGEPELVQELLEPWPDRSFLFRASNWLRKATRFSAPLSGNKSSDFGR
jgi:hypothetical protein